MYDYMQARACASPWYSGNNRSNYCYEKHQNKKKKPPWKVALLVSDKKYDDMEKWKDHNYFSSKTMQWVEITDKENFLDFTLLAGTAPHFNLTAFLK